MNCDELNNAIAYYTGQLGTLNGQISTLASQIDGAEIVVKAQDDSLGTSGGPAVTIPMTATMINMRITYLGYIASTLGGDRDGSGSDGNLAGDSWLIRFPRPKSRRSSSRKRHGTAWHRLR